MLGASPMERGDARVSTPGKDEHVSVLIWLKESWLGQAVAGSDSLWGFPTILTMHTLGMGIVVGLAAMIAMRFLGVGQRIPLAALRGAFPLIWTGFAINLSSGSLLFVAAATRIGASPVFWLKLGLVAAGLVTTFMLRGFMLPEGSGTEPPAVTKVLATVSLISWAGALTAGRLIAYLGFPG